MRVITYWDRLPREIVETPSRTQPDKTHVGPALSEELV